MYVFQVMVESIRISPDTYQLLKELKERVKARSFNKLLKDIAEKELGKTKRRIVVEEKGPADKQPEKKEEETSIPETCPHCGSRLQGNNVRVELLNVHLPVPRIGIEIQYIACPFCERPLTKTLQWKKTEKFEIPTI